MRVRPLASAGVGAAVVFTLGWIVAGAVSEPVDATRGTSTTSVRNRSHSRGSVTLDRRPRSSFAE